MNSLGKIIRVIALCGATASLANAVETTNRRPTDVTLITVETPPDPKSGAKAEERYLVMEDVPLASVIKLLAKESGINYLEDNASLNSIGDDIISVNMIEPQPREFLNQLLKMKALELWDQSGLNCVRRYTNQIDTYIHKLKDNFLDKFAGGGTGGQDINANSSGGGGGSSGGGAGGSQAQSKVAISSSASSFTPDTSWVDTVKEIVKEDDTDNRVYYNAEKQVLILYGTRSANKRLKEYLDIVDGEKNPNIYIVARIYATTANPIQKMGVDWASTLQNGLSFSLGPQTDGTGGTGTGTGTGATTTGNTLSELKDLIKTPMSSIVMKPNLQAVLNFFAQDSSAEAVAEPSALTANNREVAFTATTKIPYIGGSGATGTASGSGNGNSYDQTSFVEVGTTLNLLPRIQSDNRLKLGTALSISQLDRFVPTSVNNGVTRSVPQTSGRAYSGEFSINSGDTIIIAGLRQNQIDRSRTKVPWLGDIPFLGKAFRNQQNQKNVSYLTILITPTIVLTPEQKYAEIATLQPDDFLANSDNILGAGPDARMWTDPRPLNDAGLKNAKEANAEAKAAKLEQLARRRQKEMDTKARLQTELKEADTKAKQEAVQREISQTIDRIEKLDAEEFIQQEQSKQNAPKTKPSPKPSAQNKSAPEATDNADLFKKLNGTN